MSSLATPTRERLLNAAQELIEEGGYGAATVAAIADRTGLASGTLYRHFASKEELFVEVFRSVCDREVLAMGAAAEAMPAGSPCVDRLATVLATFADRALRRPRLAWALIAEPVDPLVDAERLAYRERYSALCAETLRAGIAAGELPEPERRARGRGARWGVRRGARRPAVSGRLPQAGTGGDRQRAAAVRATCGGSRVLMGAEADGSRGPGRARRARLSRCCSHARSDVMPSTARPRRRSRTRFGPSMLTKMLPSPCSTGRAACSAPGPT